MRPHWQASLFYCYCLCLVEIRLLLLAPSPLRPRFQSAPCDRTRRIPSSCTKLCVQTVGTCRALRQTRCSRVAAEHFYRRPPDERRQTGGRLDRLEHVIKECINLNAIQLTHQRSNGRLAIRQQLHLCVQRLLGGGVHGTAAGGEQTRVDNLLHLQPHVFDAFAELSG